MAHVSALFLIYYLSMKMSANIILGKNTDMYVGTNL